MTTSNNPPKHIDIQYRFLKVGERDFCVWDYDLVKQNHDFLQSIDPKYFDFVADSYIGFLFNKSNSKIQSILDKISDFVGKGSERNYTELENSQYAALGIRFAYSLGLETFFALLAAFTQAAMSPFAWIRLYKPWELRNIITCIHKHLPFPNALNVSQITWDSLSQVIHSSLTMEDKTLENIVKQGFSDLWGRFASDYLDPFFTEEYNSIKHGLRIRPGGFYVAMGLQSERGDKVQKENMQLLGESDFGSSFLTYEKIGEQSHHIRFVQKHRNWNPEDMAWGLKMISLSIKNILATFNVLNGVSPEKVKYSWPSEVEVFKEPWLRTRKIGVTSMSGYHVKIPVEYIEPYSTEEMSSRYFEGKDAGIRRIYVPSNNDARE